MTPERILWQKVLLQALLDISSKAQANPADREAREEAKRWVERGGKDFRTVCSLAGIHPERLQEAHRAGKIDPEFLRRLEKKSSGLPNDTD